MSEPNIKVNLTEWIESVRADRTTYIQRQMTEIILYAIAIVPFLAE